MAVNTKNTNRQTKILSFKKCFFVCVCSPFAVEGNFSRIDWSQDISTKLIFGHFLFFCFWRAIFFWRENLLKWKWFVEFCFCFFKEKKQNTSQHKRIFFVFFCVQFFCRKSKILLSFFKDSQHTLVMKVQKSFHDFWWIYDVCDPTSFWNDSEQVINPNIHKHTFFDFSHTKKRPTCFKKNINSLPHVFVVVLMVRTIECKYFSSSLSSSFKCFVFNTNGLSEKSLQPYLKKQQSKHQILCSQMQTFHFFFRKADILLCCFKDWHTL